MRNLCKSHLWRSIIAATLTLLLADPFAILISSSTSLFAAPSDYENMPREKLLAEYWRVNSKIKQLYYQMFEQISQIYYNKNDQFNREKGDLLLEILDKQYAIEAKQLSINKIEADAQFEVRELTPTERTQIYDLQQEISRLSSETGNLQQKVNKISAQRDAFEKSVWPQVKAIEDQYNWRSSLLVEEREKIFEVGKRRFPDFLNSTGASSSAKAKTKNVGYKRPTGDTVARLSDAEFMKQLLGPLGEVNARKFPKDFYRVGMLKFDQLKTDSGGNRILNLFREYEGARYFLENRYWGTDPQIYTLDTTDLVKTNEGRAYLTKIRDLLLQDSEITEFAFEIPEEGVYKKAVLEKIKPRPGFAESSASLPDLPQRPSESQLAVSEPDPASPEGKKLKTLNRARNEEILELFPELRATDHSEWIKRADELQARLEAKFDQQKQLEFNKTFQNEADAEFRSQSSENLDTFSGEHNPEAAEACVNQGKKTFNKQSSRVRRMILRGRALVDLYQKGLNNLSGSKAPWHSKGVSTLFMAVALWDLGWIWYEEGLAATVLPAATFVGISLSIPLIAAKSMLLAEGIVLGMTVLFVWDLWNRFERFMFRMLIGADSFEAYDRDLILGNRPYPLFDNEGNQYGAVPVGFRTFTGSPGYGLNQEKWFLKFRSEAELMEAIRVYEDKLEFAFGGPQNVPPRFNPVENHKLHLEVIQKEWIQKQAKEIEKLKAEIERHRSEQLSKEDNLSYQLSDKEDPKPKGKILTVKMIPELPSRNDREIKIKASYAIAGLPGDKIQLEAKQQLSNSNNPNRNSPVTETNEVDLQVEEAYKVFTTEKTFPLSGAGNYEFTFSLHLAPEGVDPEPKKIRFFIEGEEPEYEHKCKIEGKWTFVNTSYGGSKYLYVTLSGGKAKRNSETGTYSLSGSTFKIEWDKEYFHGKTWIATFRDEYCDIQFGKMLSKDGNVKYTFYASSREDIQ